MSSRLALRFLCALSVFTPLTTAIRPLGSSFGIPGRNATYDYIVVGGGNAGLTVATRLAEQQSGSVAVVEAGTFYEISNGNLSQVPGLDDNYISKRPDDWHPLIDWGYVTSPQQSALDVEMHYARGKCLGGCSARNYMIYQRGSKGTYQTWADLVGDDSYTLDNLLPYFEKSICFTPPNMELRFSNSTPLYNISVMGNCTGPLSLSYSNYAFSFASWSIEGLQAMGIPQIDGFQSGELLGSSYVVSTIDAKTMTRDSSETSFLQRALKYPNYTVYTLTMAKRILFGPDKKATGVVVDTQGDTYVLTAAKEVIVSAGVFGSPQLLMVSGVGPAVTLKELGIPVVADLPGVGQNMQDHVYFGPSYKVLGQTTSALGNPELFTDASVKFQENASGMLTNPSNDVLGWEKLPEPIRSTLSADARHALEQYPTDWPEVEYLAIAAYLGYQNISGGSDPHDGFNYATMGVAIVMPQSRGNLTITSADNAVQPVINPNFFSNSIDMEVAIAGYRRVREFFNTTAVQPFLLDRQEAFPGLDVSTDEDLAQIIKETFLTIFHAACTCSMGKSDNPMAVVDAEARVYGVSDLRVVDASIFPILPPGHPMATVYALAEKIASTITGSE
ncbi:choline dehydrogenase, putative [Talaromyces stipitatus ATCC 10500]|uniref:Choline dehydrogenase, putative n=1 Tax=Talaromyces stipitatus (strain ATCC 10500 / CBS 375.48 / QM 6759 / NRRL 1006) TaxID=441959 RepID=B8MLS2_TALSN|nr:choline dehydrogenase, putative [Talaromyces stipitatus ATCC 10500]EED13644.1 choline dehydrogenase, putative [Talaromyces stipitatus ATCC 10500]